jgi:hypothetical protein
LAAGSISARNSAPLSNACIIAISRVGLVVPAGNPARPHPGVNCPPTLRAADACRRWGVADVPGNTEPWSRAKECRENAEHAASPEIKEQWVRLAQFFSERAVLADRQSPLDGGNNRRKEPAHSSKSGRWLARRRHTRG